jgi:hypothetical protein
VREAIFEMMRFWLEKGIDGFRVEISSGFESFSNRSQLDVINFISKVHGFPDAPNTIPGLTQPGGVMFLNGHVSTIPNILVAD